ncbi:MAG: hypothetical protein H3C47_16570, partial [Candidatus Cloacimonetes bacterium]|nr:hypothetical protein [Candidatus Cloacimonadota bacterium]
MKPGDIVLIRDVLDDERDFPSNLYEEYFFQVITEDEPFVSIAYLKKEGLIPKKELALCFYTLVGGYEEAKVVAHREIPFEIDFLHFLGKGEDRYELSWGDSLERYKDGDCYPYDIKEILIACALLKTDHPMVLYLHNPKLPYPVFSPLDTKLSSYVGLHESLRQDVPGWRFLSNFKMTHFDCWVDPVEYRIGECFLVFLPQSQNYGIVQILHEIRMPLQPDYEFENMLKKDTGFYGVVMLLDERVFSSEEEALEGLFSGINPWIALITNLIHIDFKMWPSLGCAPYSKSPSFTAQYQTNWAGHNQFHTSAIYLLMEARHGFREWTENLRQVEETGLHL